MAVLHMLSKPGEVCSIVMCELVYTSETVKVHMLSIIMVLAVPDCYRKSLQKIQSPHCTPVDTGCVYDTHCVNLCN